MKPSEIPVNVTGCIGDTLGKHEAEAAAAVLVLYLREHGDDWVGVTGNQMADWMKASEAILHWVKNPYWQPNPQLLKDNGLITGWEHPDDPMLVTPRLVELLSTPGLWRTLPEPVIKRGPKDAGA